jgi:hypothetical protein
MRVEALLVDRKGFTREMVLTDLRDVILVPVRARFSLSRADEVPLLEAPEVAEFRIHSARTIGPRHYRAEYREV